jgi:hypothetical protein
LESLKGKGYSEDLGVDDSGNRVERFGLDFCLKTGKTGVPLNTILDLRVA